MNINNLSSDTFQKVTPGSPNFQKENAQTGFPSAAIVDEGVTVSKKSGLLETKSEIITQTTVERDLLMPNKKSIDKVMYAGIIFMVISALLAYALSFSF